MKDIFKFLLYFNFLVANGLQTETILTYLKTIDRWSENKSPKMLTDQNYCLSMDKQHTHNTNIAQHSSTFLRLLYTYFRRKYTWLIPLHIPIAEIRFFAQHSCKKERLIIEISIQKLFLLTQSSHLRDNLNKKFF